MRLSLDPTNAQLFHLAPTEQEALSFFAESADARDKIALIFREFCRMQSLESGEDDDLFDLSSLSKSDDKLRMFDDNMVDTSSAAVISVNENDTIAIDQIHEEEEIHSSDATDDKDDDRSECDSIPFEPANTKLPCTTAPSDTTCSTSTSNTTVTSKGRSSTVVRTIQSTICKLANF